MPEHYEKYTKVVTADFPRFTVHSSIPTGASLRIVFDHYRLIRDRRDPKRKQLNLFFMSGTGMTKMVWKYYISRLYAYSESQKEGLCWQLVNCVALDLVNHGDSAVENEGLLGWEIDWRDGAHDLIQVAKTLRLPGVSVAVGHSMGGFQVLYAASVAPLLFKFVISIEPVTHRVGVETEAGLRGFKKMLGSLDRVIRSEFKNEMDFITYFKNFSFYRNFDQEIFEDFITSERITNKDGTVTAKTSKEQQILCYLGGMRTFPIGLDILKQINVPVVHVVGGKGQWNSSKDINEANEALKYLDLVIIPEGEHLVNGERPDEVLQVIKEKLNKFTKDIDGEEEYGFGERNDVLSKEEVDKVFEINYQKLEKEYFKASKAKL